MVIRLIDEFGLSGDDIVSYLVEKGKLSPNASTDSPQATSVSEYQTPRRILPGKYVYSDGLIYPDVIAGRQVKAL